jgi:hypothetical protein
MNFQVKGLGAERKKIVILGAVLAVLAAVLCYNWLAPSDGAPAPAERAARSAVPAAGPEPGGGMFGPPAETRQRPQLRPGRGGARPEFKLGLKDKQPDPASINPALRLDLLAKVRAVSMAGGVRNLFQFGAAPLPPAPERKIVPFGAKPAGVAALAAPTPAPGPPPPPPPPPIPLKFYGYAAPAPSGAKRVFLLDGEDIIVAAEGQLVKSRYKLVRVGINSVVLEDVQFKHEQTLPLEEEKVGQTG